LKSKHVPDALEGSIARAGNETHEFAGVSIGSMGCEQHLMRRFMDQVSGENHGMGAEQDSGDIENHGVRSHECKGSEPTAAGPCQYRGVG
jgi:hypothetical protein